MNSFNQYKIIFWLFFCILATKVFFLFFSGRPALFPTSYMVGREDKRTNNRTMLPTLKKKKDNAAAGCQGPVKIELLKGAGLLFFLYLFVIFLEKPHCKGSIKYVNING